MGAPRFLVDLALHVADVGGEVALSDGVAHHALRVLRLQVGDAITLFTGRGGEYAATLTHAGKREARARIDGYDPVERESRLSLTLVQSIAAGDTMDAIVRHSVELGCAAIQPVVTERSARFPASAQGGRRLAHWRGIVEGACEQCGRNRVPEVREPVTLPEWLASVRKGIVLDGLAQCTLSGVEVRGAADILVGPEGGLTRDEIARATHAGLRPVRLGSRILRAGTASLAALAAINALSGDFR
jgi:16S rRNA (uracil1498-N3)-methyltransferase